MKIKAISIWQPWASLIAVGAKTFETRGWATSYRGPLLICAAKRPMDRETMAFFVGFVHSEVPEIQDDLPFGKAVALVDLVGCIATRSYGFSVKGLDLHPTDPEYPFGDFSLGRYAWKLENVRAIEPFPVTGRQGLFWVEVPDDLLNEENEWTPSKQ